MGAERLVMLRPLTSVVTVLSKVVSKVLKRAESWREQKRERKRKRERERVQLDSEERRVDMVSCFEQRECCPQ